MIARLGLILSRTIGRCIPDPLILALGLTILTAILAFTFGYGELDRRETALVLIDTWWSSGLWKFLQFSMQMALILVTGYALADSPIIRRFLGRIAQLPQSPGQAAALVGFVAALTGLVNWGLGLIVGALLARDVGRSMEARGRASHFPLLCAAGYVGLLVWHGGLSGSAALKSSTLTEAKDLLGEDLMSRLATMGFADGIPLSDTTFSTMNLVVSGGLLIIIPLVLWLLAPSGSECRSLSQVDANPMPEETRGKITINESWGPIGMLFSFIVAAALVAGFLIFLTDDSRGIMRLGPNQFNAVMLGIGLILHGSPIAYARSIERAARGCAGILIQFPLYAGILIMLRDSGLMADIARFAADISTETTLPFFTFLSAGVVNFLVPSGGGQWGVQGPIAIQSAMESGVSIPKMLMAVSYGDELTNMLQPFWALPLLAITGVKARDIVGYTALVMLAAGTWMTIWLLIW
ncbi:MAG: serine--pyruvate aminotransferase [Phycisphaerae bacterium]|nr:serine--pyruvate aminotransferase [Phycisphaerae bacterium]